MIPIFNRKTNKFIAKAYLKDQSDIEPSAMDQIEKVAELPFVKYQRIMPDVHMGHGASIGSVIACKGAVVPNLVGVDIGCGMTALKLSGCKGKDPAKLRKLIEAAVPVGFTKHAEDQDTSLLLEHLHCYHSIFSNVESKWKKQIGTLGGGNHFIELCTDESGDIWLMIHSGSRGVGHAVACSYRNEAIQDMDDHYISEEYKSLEFIPQSSDQYHKYIEDVQWCQTYAYENRIRMVELVLGAIDAKMDGEPIQCHHNYLSIENHKGENLLVTRKGAIQARKGTLGIIPGSMGTKSYIVKGKGHTEGLCSCSHGAGRAMSRTEARRRFTTEDLIEQTSGVECRKDIDVVDEIPAAYKDIDTVMKNQSEAVEILHTLKQFVCVKG